MRLTIQLLLLIAVASSMASAQDCPSPYGAEKAAAEFAEVHSVAEIRKEGDAWAKKAKTAKELAYVAELYKRIGDGKAREFYEKAIAADPNEPAYEAFLGTYFRLYRGAGQRPLFPAAEKHLVASFSKLSRMPNDSCGFTDWGSEVTARVERSLTSLYERDGIPLLKRAANTQSEVRQPWLFFSPASRWEQGAADLDRSSDVRDLTSAALFSNNSLQGQAGRLAGSLTDEQLSGMARVVTAYEGSGRLRMRYKSAPVVDVSLSRHRAYDAQTTNFFNPTGFNPVKLTSLGIRIEKPFTIGGTADASVYVAYSGADRKGLIEFQPTAHERLQQFETGGAFSQYVGPDRLNISYTFTRQNINPDPANMADRDRRIVGGSVMYQIFRRNLNSGLGRTFETRGIDLYAGTLDDKESYPATSAEVLVRRRDYFAGVAARGLGRLDLTFQPTLYTNHVSNDRSQTNSQVRSAGNVLIRILDEERTAGIPSQHFIGLPVGFVQLVLPFHWDAPKSGIADFRSRKLGIELWSKFFTNKESGGTTFLAVVGYSRQWFPELNRDFNLARASLSIGF